MTIVVVKGTMGCTRLWHYERHLYRFSSSIEDAERHGLRTKSELVGESLREIGILLLVFVPVDALLKEGRLNLFQIVTGVVLAGGGFFLVRTGIRIEGRG